MNVYKQAVDRWGHASQLLQNHKTLSFAGGYDVAERAELSHFLNQVFDATA